MKINPILNVDSYKHSHYLQYPPNAKYLSDYVMARGGVYPFTIPFGGQAFRKEYLGKAITRANIDEAEHILQFHMPEMPFNRAGWEYILEEHDGYFPVEIEEVPEGTRVPTKNVLAQVRNTDPKVPWITSFVETAYLRAIWYPTTVATISRYIKDILEKYARETSTEEDVNFSLHDFGSRGVSSTESSMLGGLAHLVNFMGTDNLISLPAGVEWYQAKYETLAMSVPAAEHSTITSWGKNRELDAYMNMVSQFSEEGAIYAVVSDSYDLWNAIEHLWGDILQDTVRQRKGRLVIRPDSGDPLEVCTKAMEMVWAKFGGTTNLKGYRVLDPIVRLIQGDGVDPVSIAAILKRFKELGFASENIAFGMGGALLQRLDRDTLGFAMKTSAISFDNTPDDWKPVFKDPVTDPGKSSIHGRLSLVDTKSPSVSHVTVAVDNDRLRPNQDMLQTVYKNGCLLNLQTFAQIRKRSNAKA